ncbi:MAG TPA: response regulator [Xanthobacteraceae bacterium]|nr:response regulator [Xanthobacteraceae bacterium]
MAPDEKVNILLVDDQPNKLLAYEVILRDLGENLISATSAREALEHLLKTDIAVILVDVCMPELDGFELAAMIREHPRFQRTAIIFVSAINLTDVDRLRGYELGAVDYVPVPVISEVLRAKVRVFAELYRKTRQLEQLNAELELRVAERTAELQESARELRQSEQRRNLALVAGQMGSWDWDLVNGDWMWDEGQCRIFGVDPATFEVSLDSVGKLVHPQDLARLQQMVTEFTSGGAQAFQTEFRVFRPDGETRWCYGTAAPTLDGDGRVVRVSGVTVDITERKQAEERQALLAREVDHRARNTLAVVQAIIRLTRAETKEAYVALIEGRIKALAQVHSLLADSRWLGADLGQLVDEELAPYREGEPEKVTAAGPRISLDPATAQILALALHELATNAAKHGALSMPAGKLHLVWDLQPGRIELQWMESGGPSVATPKSFGFGVKVVTASVEGQLGGKAMFDWRAEGLHCRLSVPRIEKSEPGKDKQNGNAKSGAGQARSSNQILLVEDEVLVGMAMRDLLTELGYDVLGPYGDVAEAISAASGNAIAAAVLDVNLAGTLVYPLADELATRQVPFVFVTGYGVESIDRKFSSVPVVKKPVEGQALRQALSATTGALPRTYQAAAGG